MSDTTGPAQGSGGGAVAGTGVALPSSILVGLAMPPLAAVFLVAGCSDDPPQASSGRITEPLAIGTTHRYVFPMHCGVRLLVVDGQAWVSSPGPWPGTALGPRDPWLRDAARGT